MFLGTSDILSYTEHYDYTTAIQFSYNGLFHRDTSGILNFGSDDTNVWMNPPINVVNDKEVRTGSCDLGECIMTNDTVVDNVN